MALKNNTDNSYLRISIKDEHPTNIGLRVFVLEHHRDEGARQSPTDFDKVKENSVNLASGWNLTVDGSTTLDEIVSEAYRVLKTLPEFSSGWTDV